MIKLSYRLWGPIRAFTTHMRRSQSELALAIPVAALLLGIIIVTEAEALSSLIELADVAATQVTLWLSMTFAFLTASHFVGKALSRFQCLVISGLYVFVSAIYGTAVVMHANAWVLLRAREQTILDEVWIAQNMIGWEGGISFFLVGGTLSSLIFMYSARRTKPE